VTVACGIARTPTSDHNAHFAEGAGLVAALDAHDGGGHDHRVISGEHDLAGRGAALIGRPANSRSA
jgi:hypothetical protein